MGMRVLSGGVLQVGGVTRALTYRQHAALPIAYESIKSYYQRLANNPFTLDPAIHYLKISANVVPS